MHAISSNRGNGHTNTQTHTQTNSQTGPITIHCSAKLSAQCNEQNLFAVGVAALSQIPSLSLGTCAPICCCYKYRLTFLAVAALEKKNGC